MSRNKAQLVQDWQTEGGDFLPFNQGDELDLDPFSNVLDNTGGVCSAMTTYWVRARKNGKHGESLFKSISSGSNWQMIKGAQLDDDAGYDDAGGHNDLSRKTKLGSRQLHSREAILEEILSHRGLYILTARRKNGSGGHAISFDTTPADLYFMDPNGGQFWFMHVNATKDGFFKAWFKDWWVALNYKTRYHEGARKLMKYS